MSDKKEMTAKGNKAVEKKLQQDAVAAEAKAPTEILPQDGDTGGGENQGVKAEDQTKPDGGAKAVKPDLKNIDELASENRVASWQMAALKRLMSWESGKKVTEKEFQDALGKLKTRRMGN